MSTTSTTTCSEHWATSSCEGLKARQAEATLSPTDMGHQRPWTNYRLWLLANVQADHDARPQRHPLFSASQSHGRAPLLPSWNVVRLLRHPVCGSADEVMDGQRATTGARNTRPPLRVSAPSQKQRDLRRRSQRRRRRSSMAPAPDGAASPLARASHLRRRLSVFRFLPSASIRPEPALCALGEYRPNLNPHLSSPHTSC